MARLLSLLRRQAFGLAILACAALAFTFPSAFTEWGGVKLTAYQIVAGDWDSGKTASASMQAALPLPLRSRQRVAWKIRLWDENDRPGAWTEAAFETGLLDAADWQAKWITGGYTPDKKRRYPVDCFRKAGDAGYSPAWLYLGKL